MRKNRREFIPRVEPTFSVMDFQQVEREIDALRQPELQYKEVEQNWLVKRGAVKIRNGEMFVITENYRICSALLSEYYDWKGRKEFGQKKQLEGYSKVAEQMSV